MLNIFLNKKRTQSGLLYFIHTVNAFRFLVLSFLPTALFAQFDNNYIPIKAKGEMPSRFYQTLTGETEIKIVLEDADLSKKRQKAFETTTRFTLQQIFLSGSIYYNDPCTPYVREVMESLLATVSPKPQIDVFVSRFASPNAAIWQDGTLIINIGLLARLENETQLAFVLAHEIGHYQNNHPFRQYARQNQPDNIQKRALDNLKASVAYTQEKEEEADAFALELLTQAGYDNDEGRKALDLILKDFVSENCMSHFFPIDEADMCSELEVQTYINMDRRTAGHFAPLIVKKRQEEMEHSAASQDEVASKDDVYMASPNDFEAIRHIAQFELIENNYSEADYISTLYYAMILQKKYRDNIYLSAKIAESLFQLYFYKKRGAIDRILKVNRENNAQKEILRLSCFMRKVDEDTLQELVGTYLSTQYKNWGEVDETIAITMAKYMEATTGREEAKSYFQHCTKHFPQGKHYLYAKARCE